MTISAEASAVVAANPRQILEFVLDLERYAQIDAKFVRVTSVEGPDDAGHGTLKLWGRVKGLPPAPDQQDFTLQRWSGLTFVGAPRQPARLVFDFTGTFECEPRAGGTTLVRHAYDFAFKGPFRLVERSLAPWLQDQIQDEVDALESAVTSGRP